MTYEEWEESIPEVIKGDTLWKVEAYRLGMFLSDLAWHDGIKLLRNALTRENGRPIAARGR